MSKHGKKAMEIYLGAVYNAIASTAYKSSTTLDSNGPVIGDLLNLERELSLYTCVQFTYYSVNYG